MNLSARIALVGGVAVLLSLGGGLAACGPRDGGGTGGGSGTGGNTGTGGGNCAPFCAGTGGGTGGSAGSGTGGNTGGGTGGSGTGGNTGGGSGGSGVGGGSSGFDAGQIAAAKRRNFGDNVLLTGVVVTGVDNQFLGSGGDVQSSFWVAEPSNPTVGLYIFKNFTDLVGFSPSTLKTDGGVSIGDIVNVQGFLATPFPDNGAVAYRYELKNKTGGMPVPQLQVVVTGHGSPLADNDVTGPFGVNADGGRPKGLTPADQHRMPFDQARVHIPGPLTLSNADPVELHRVNDTPAGTVFGFEASGTAVPAGLLVRNQRVFALSDGGSSLGDGTPACDYRQMVADGGRMVSFPNGIRGVWTTFAQSPCYSGTASCTGNNTRDAGYVPGLNVPYTWVLQPLDCSDLAGATVTP